MSNGHGEETPVNKIATAQAVLSLAIRLSQEVQDGRINKEIFAREVGVITGGTGVMVPAYPEGSNEDLKDGIFNIFLVTLSASALTLDETLNEAFGDLSKETDKDFFGLRVMVKQLRNAFAHNPWRPKWQVNPKYRCVYPIRLDDGSNFNFDATDLDGGDITPKQVGGFEFWIKLLQHCERAVQI